MNTVLIVDDDVVDREIARRAILSGMGDFNVIEADDGEQAKAIIQQNNVDCVLLDYLLPGEDGISFIERLSRDLDCPEFAIIMMTGEGSEEVAIEAIKAGFHDYVIKSLMSGIGHRILHAIDRVKLAQAKRAAEISLAANARELEQALKQVQLANRARADFLTRVSHELRTPLNSIIGYAQMMQLEMRGDLPDTYKEYADRIGQSGEDLLKMVDAVLDMRALEAGKMEIFKQRCEVGALAADVVGALQPVADESGVSIRAVVEGDHVEASVDPVRIKQVFFNLIGNAIKFAAGGTVTVGVRRDNGTLRVDIVDDGIGMAKHQIGAALEPFRQANMNIYAQKYAGAGLGLPIARGLVELHGGSLRIESRPAEGTAIRVDMPAV